MKERDVLLRPVTERLPNFRFVDVAAVTAPPWGWYDARRPRLWRCGLMSDGEIAI